MMPLKETGLKECVECGGYFSRPIYPSGKRMSPASFSKRRFCSRGCNLKNRWGDRAKGECRACGAKSPMDSRTHGALCADCRSDYLSERHKKNADFYGYRTALNTWKLKMQTLAAYGGAVCACCGENRAYFLTIDHIGGGGREHRKLINGVSGRGGDNFYGRLRTLGFPNGDKMRVLCMNCNTSLGFWGFCPHVESDPIGRQLWWDAGGRLPKLSESSVLSAKVGEYAKRKRKHGKARNTNRSTRKQ